MGQNEKGLEDRSVPRQIHTAIAVIATTTAFTATIAIAIAIATTTFTTATANFGGKFCGVCGAPMRGRITIRGVCRLQTVQLERDEMQHPRCDVGGGLGILAIVLPLRLGLG